MTTSGPTNPTQALLAALSAFHAAEDRVALLPELERLAREADALDEVAEALESASESVESAPVLCALLRLAARLREELGEPTKAVVLWNDLLAAQPVDVEALDALARLFAQSNDFLRAAEVSVRRARLLHLGPERHARFVAAADFLMRAGNRAAALEALDESLSRPAVAEAVSAVGAVHVRRGRLLKTLERLYEQTGNAAGLAATLERSLALAKGAPASERVPLALRLARLKLAPPEDDARALELLREVLTLAPGNAQAVAALAQLASTPGPAQAAASELVAPALDALGDYPGVVQLLEAQLATQSSARERVATLPNLFAVTRTAEALVPLERVLGAAGRHLERAEALSRLGELALKAGDEKAYVDRLVQRARALTAAGEVERAVQVYADVLQRAVDEPRAVTDLVALVADARVREPAAELLASVFAAPAQRAQRASVLEVLAGMADLARARTFRAELASLHEQLGDLTQAFAGWLRLVREHPEDASARAEVERLAAAGHLEEDLVATYEELLELRPPLPKELQRHLQATAARLYAGPLKAPDAALRTWESLARGDRDALEPLVALEPIYRERGDWVRLAEVLDRQARLHAGEARVESLRRLAELAEGPLKDAALAADALGRLLDVEPGDRRALRALARLHESSGHRRQAAELLERLIALLDAAAATADVAELSVEAGRLRADEPARAVEHFARAAPAVRGRGGPRARGAAGRRRGRARARRGGIGAHLPGAGGPAPTGCRARAAGPHREPGAPGDAAGGVGRAARGARRVPRGLRGQAGAVRAPAPDARRRRSPAARRGDRPPGRAGGGPDGAARAVSRRRRGAGALASRRRRAAAAGRRAESAGGGARAARAGARRRAGAGAGDRAAAGRGALGRARRRPAAPLRAGHE